MWHGDCWRMNIVSSIGVVLTIAGVAGYIAGITTPYPGRAFSVTAVMAGVTMMAVGRSAPLEGQP